MRRNLLQVIRSVLRGLTLGERGRAHRRVLRSALKTVRDEVDDERALTVIDRIVKMDRAAAEKARRELGDRSPTYEADRAGRLLDAALSGSGTVAPADPRVATLFAEEAALARMPIRDAMKLLREREPELDRISTGIAELFTATVRDSHETEAEVARWRAIGRARIEAMGDVSKILGPQSQQTDGLLRSYIARNIGLQAIELASGNRRKVNADAPYFGGASGLEHDEGERA
jgi:hypothetical protein